MQWNNDSTFNIFLTQSLLYQAQYLNSSFICLNVVVKEVISHFNPKNSGVLYLVLWIYSVLRGLLNLFLNEMTYMLVINFSRHSCLRFADVSSIVFQCSFCFFFFFKRSETSLMHFTYVIILFFLCVLPNYFSSLPFLKNNCCIQLCLSFIKFLKTWSPFW